MSNQSNFKSTPKEHQDPAFLELVQLARDLADTNESLAKRNEELYQQVISQRDHIARVEFGYYQLQQMIPKQ